MTCLRSDGEPEPSAQPTRALEHEAFFYASPEEFVQGTLEFIRGGLDQAFPTLVAVPRAGTRLAGHLPESAGLLRLVEMSEIGRNPSRIIPMVASWAGTHPGRRLHFVGEPVWPGRSPAEIEECTRHEALLNDAFATADLTIFCPYDGARLDSATLADAERTHPTVYAGQRRRSSPAYTTPAAIYRRAAPLLPAIPPDAEVLRYGLRDLARVREVVRGHARRAGLSVGRVDDLLLAVHELATNTLRHTTAQGTLRIWVEPTELVCELSDSGQIHDPMIGRHPPGTDREDGRGLWLVNQLCDLVQIRSDEEGTTIRLHARVAR